jgi:hypothetical protein
MQRRREEAYNFSMRRHVCPAPVWAVIVLVVGFSACVTRVPGLPESDEVSGPLVVGRTVTVLTGERGRMYEPKLRFFEVENQDTNQRFNVDVDAQDHYFALSFPPGKYRINRVQISEGPFMSMADLSSTFSVGTERLTYVGTWRIGVGSTGYGRMVRVSMVLTPEEAVQTRDFLRDQYPEIEAQSMVDTLPQPSQVETRLYEVMPYPRYPRYFRRHWW